MQLASKGTRTLARAHPKAHQSHLPARSLHFSRAPAPSTAQRIFTHTRTLLTRFVTHLTAPGTLLPTTVPRSVSLNARSGIQQGLSFPVRTALSRPLHGSFFPRPPALKASTTQVGFGCVRNFTSSRPIFQNLVENVPIAGRAFWEADLQLKMNEERQRMVGKPKTQRNKENHGHVTLKPREQNTQTFAVEHEAELDHYFPAPAVAEVTTYLLIPLAATPSSHFPLPLTATAHHPLLLSLADIAALHAEHTVHSHRVSALFARLDAAKVWVRGASCSAYGHEGVCTVLRVEFVGWTKNEVRGVIGESGSGWCVMEEKWGADDVSDAMSVSSQEPAMMEVIDPARSFIMPTLDFSASFLDAASPRSTQAHSQPPSPLRSGGLLSANSSMSDLSSLVDVDAWSDAGSDLSEQSAVLVQSPVSFGVAFSSDFECRAEESARA